MKKTAYILCAVALPVLTTACIDDDDENCPSDYAVEVSIMDKNYTNIAQFPQLPPEEENQPFAHFSSTLFYTLTDGQTNQVVRQSSITPITTIQPTYTLGLENLPSGEYTLTVWGNLTENVPVGILHPNKKEHTDIYVGTTRICTGCEKSYTLGLERSKGGILLLCNNFPTTITRIHQTLSGVYSETDNTLNYTGTAIVEKDTPLAKVNTMFAAPTAPGKKAKLSLNFYTSDSDIPLFTTPEVELEIHRNELTAVTTDYNQQSGYLNIWIYTDGQWTLIHHLNIE